MHPEGTNAVSERRKISIITCVWNQCDQFFSECAASVAAMPADIEWVVTDDGSSPHVTRSYHRIIETVARNVPVRFIKLAQRSGLARARNVALENATGEWVVILDSDDWLASNLGEMLVALPRHFGLVAFETAYFDDFGYEYRRIRHFEYLFNLYGGTILDPFLWFDFYYHGIIARRDLLRRIGGYRDELRVGEDQDILCRAIEALSREEVRFVHELGYGYRNNPDGVCLRQWEAVERNYTNTMLNAANRRGANFSACRFGGFREIDDSRVDQYEYRHSCGGWLSWETTLERYQQTGAGSA